MRLPDPRRPLLTIVGRGRLPAVRPALRLVANRRDIPRYLAYRNGWVPGHRETAFAVRRMPNVPFTCRAGTTDARTLEDTFVGNYHLPPAPIVEDGAILDLGANAGYTAADFASRYPKARVIAVELDPDNAALARRNLAPFGERVEVIEAAIWTESGTIAYGGTREDAYRIDEAATGREARAITVDELLDEAGVGGRVAYAKMDIEGAEAAVLSGGGSWLPRIDVLSVEVHPPATVDDIVRILTKAGFEATRDPRHWSSVAAVRAQH